MKAVGSGGLRGSANTLPVWTVKPGSTDGEDDAESGHSGGAGEDMAATEEKPVMGATEERPVMGAKEEKPAWANPAKGTGELSMSSGRAGKTVQAMVGNAVRGADLLSEKANPS